MVKSKADLKGVRKMRSKEALETVKDYLLPKLKEDNSELGSIIIVESVNVLEELVERDTSMKVVKEVDKKYVDAKEFYERDIYRCGSCNNVLIIDRYQRLEDKDKDRKSTRLNSSHVRISYAVFCLKKKK